MYPAILNLFFKFSGGLFGGTLETVVNRENMSILPGGMGSSTISLSQNVPLIIKRCVEEIERRGLDIIGRLNNEDLTVFNIRDVTTKRKSEKKSLLQF